MTLMASRQALSSRPQLGGDVGGERAAAVVEEGTMPGDHHTDWLALALAAEVGFELALPRSWR